MTCKTISSIAAVLCIITLLVTAGPASAQTIVGNVFVTGFDGWTDTCVPYTDPTTLVTQKAPNWGVLLGDDKSLSESNNLIPGDYLNSAFVGDYTSQNMINTLYTTPSNYTITARMGTWDDDGYGLVFGYENESNFFRIGFRQQTGSSAGYPSGISLQKVVAGVPVLLGQDESIIDDLPYNDGSYFDVSVTVAGSSYSIKANPANPDGGAEAMVEYFSGSDTDLPDMAAGHYGVHSWAQQSDTAANTSPVMQRGTLVKEISVASTTFNKTTVFADASPVDWRAMDMTNAESLKLSGIDRGQTYAAGEDYGNFRLDFRDGTIQDDTNGYEFASSTAANIDFMGPAIVVDEPGNGDWTDYEMKVRVQCGDNEGPSLLVRVQDDRTFYRVNFASEAMGAGNDRPPQGMSIQKCVASGFLGTTWTELYREDQAGTPFAYTEDQPFDVKVKVVGNAITVSVITDPDGTPTTINYATVLDESDPILSGSVGLSNFGAGDVTNGVIYSAYGGGAGSLLVVASIDDRIPGDANGDLKVDAADVSIMAANWGAVSATWEMGDFSENGTVGPEDAKLLSQNWGTGGGSEAAAVPEPSTMILLLGALAGLIGVRRR